MTVKELLGHANLTMTMRYSHLAPDHRTRAIKTLDSAYQTDTKTDTVKTQGVSCRANLLIYLVGLDGFEPSTSRLSGVRSNRAEL